MVTENVETLCQKARQAVAQGDNEQARQFYTQALALKSEAPDVHYGLATVCFLLSDLQSAVHHFREVTRLDPLRAGAHINLGAVYNRLDMIDEAIQVLRRGIQLDTRRAEGFYNLGLAYRKKRQLDLAIQAYQEATRLNPRMADAHLNLANVYLDKGQSGLAISQYQQALAIRPNWEKAENGLAQAEKTLASLRQPPSGSLAAPETVKEKGSPASSRSTVVLDPERTLDPNIHGAHLANLHQATIETENQGRNFAQVLEKEIEPAIKELRAACFIPAALWAAWTHASRNSRTPFIACAAPSAACKAASSRFARSGHSWSKPSVLCRFVSRAAESISASAIPTARSAQTRTTPGSMAIFVAEGRVNREDLSIRLSHLALAAATRDGHAHFRSQTSTPMEKRKAVAARGQKTPQSVAASARDARSSAAARHRRCS